jgi:anti-anti-sigma factor
MSAEPDPSSFSAAEEATLTWEVVTERSAARVRPLGSLDLATESPLEEQLAGLRDAGFRELIVDLSGLEFMDSTGLRLVLRWEAAARDDTFSISWVPGPPEVQRVFELTATADHVAFVKPG